MDYTLKNLFIDMTDEEWEPIVQRIASEEYARAHRFMVPLALESVNLSKPAKPHPKSGEKKKEQLDLIVKTFEGDYIHRLKSGFQLILDELGNMASEEDFA